MRILGAFLFLWSLQAAAYSSYHLREKLFVVRTGWDFFKSQNNFGPDGDRTELRTAGSPSSLIQNSFILGADYGLTDDWSVAFRTSALNAQVSPVSSGQGLSSGFGISDTGIGFGWHTRKGRTRFGTEGLIYFPPYSISDLGNQDLAIGDGVANVVLRTPLSFKARRFLFSLSPGLRLRFGRFSHQFLIDSSMEVYLKKVVLGLFEEGFFSFSQTSSPSSSGINSEAGSGGSFSRLSLSPACLSVGLTIGYQISEKVKADTFVSQTVWGHSAADGFKVGVHLSSKFDFFSPDTREAVKEVPLSSD